MAPFLLERSVKISYNNYRDYDRALDGFYSENAERENKREAAKGIMET